MDVSTMNPEGTGNFTSHSSMSFHMDRGRLVCNQCNGYYPNLVLFENHSHQDLPGVQSQQPVRSGPKSKHVTFSSYSNDDLQKAFHNMPELAGCWIQNGMYYCGQCGKQFGNPYILFSHKILHPSDRVLRNPSRTKSTSTSKRRHDCHESGTSSDEDWTEVYPYRKKVEYAVTVENVAKQGNRTVVHVTEDEHVKTKLTSGFAPDQEDNSGPTMVMKACYDSDSDDSGKTLDCRVKKQLIKAFSTRKKYRNKYHEAIKDTAWRTYVTKNGTPMDELCKRKRGPTPGTSACGEEPRKRHITNPGIEKGLVFTDMDAEVMLKVFRKLPGLGNCSVDHKGHFKCDKCCYSFENPYLLFTHRLHHVLRKAPNGNTESNLVLYNMPGLENCRLEDGRYHCDGCTEYFSNQYLLFTHRMKHADADDEEDPGTTADIQIDDSLDIRNMFNSSSLDKCQVYRGRYLCNECAAVFRNPYLLLNHKVLHRKGGTAASVGSAPQSEDAAGNVSVDGPQLKVTSVSVLDVENDSTSTTMDDDFYECNLCELQFKTMDSLINHVKAHIKEEDASADAAREVTQGSQGETNPISKGETNPISQVQTIPNLPAESTQDDFSKIKIYHGIPSLSHERNEEMPISKDETPTRKVYVMGPKIEPIREATPSAQTETDPISQETFAMSQGETTSSPSGDSSLSTIKVYDRIPNTDSVREVTPSSQTKTNPISQEETTPSSHVASPRIVKRIKVKVAIVPVKSNSDTMFYYDPRITLKRAVIKLERLDVDPSDIVFIPS